jgi:hypothetical protein
MIIGNIVTNKKIDDQNFKVCRKIDTIKKGVPTLIIGWDKTKETFGDKVSIIKKQIDEDTEWTFSPTERKVDFEKDLSDFIERCYKNIFNGVTYLYVDFIHGSKKNIIKIIRKLYTSDNIITYYHDDRMLYILVEGVILGIDLEVVEYIGHDRDKIINKVKAISQQFLTENEIFIKYEYFLPKLNNDYRFIPYLCDIDNE